ncbi:21 kDa protein [Apium graveolens]|uniref:21 kDa protein n=1 Tax=Apium graveolens TaxID=4045 RepID=UPI003D78C209
MASLGLYLLLIFSFQYITYIRGSFVVTTSTPRATNFIKTSCKATSYPVLCFQLLSVYAGKIQQNEHELARAALSVSLAKAESTTVFVSRMPKVRGIKPREFKAVKDCIDNMQNTVNQLHRSMKELDLMDKVRVQDFVWHMSNVQTWISAALTFENTCIEGFSGPLWDGRIKASVKGRVVSVAQVTSNALALVNQFMVRRQATAAPSNIP